MKIIGEKVKCARTMQLLKKTLEAGYIDPETKGLVIPDRGTPQGSVLSPLLSNIVLHELDKHMAKLEQTFRKGTKRARNREYDKIHSKIQNLVNRHPDRKEEIKELIKQRRRLKSNNTMDPNFKRLMYLRYADDFIVLITGSHHDAIHIKSQIKRQLGNKCGLELHDEKTLITRTKEGFHFLGA